MQILWDFTIHTDHVVEHTQLDTVVLDKEEKTGQLKDFAVPGDRNIEIKERIQKEKDLVRKLP